MIGNVYDGVIKAKSRVGKWYYVQPCVREDDDMPSEVSWPVGVANTLTEVTEGQVIGSTQNNSYSVGDHVRVRLDGIDERRGQLALTLMD
jgi:hypothetical protein